MNKYIAMFATLLTTLAATAQTTITFDSEEPEYKAIGIYDTWEESPFRTGEMTGRTAVVTNHLNEIDDLLGEAANATGKMLAFQRSRFGSNTFGVRVDLKEPIELTPTAKYVHALIHKPVVGRTLLVGLGKRNDRPEQPQDVEQFWELSSVDLVAGKWQDAVYTIKGAGNISIYSLVFVVDCESPHNLTEDFVAYVDEIEVNNNPVQRIVYTDYALNFDKNAQSTNDGRWIKSIAFNGSADGDKSITLNTAQNKQMYYDLTEKSAFTAKAGDTITPTFEMNGNWMNGYVYLDRGNDGRFHATINDDLSIPTGSDIMAYSFYNGSSNGELAGKNSAGQAVSGNARNTLNTPAFTIPADLANGIYRMRYKIDWNSVDPGGNQLEDNKITANGGAIVDVRLNVHGATTTISAHQRNCELLSAETGEGLGGTVVPFNEGYRIKVVPSNGFAYRGVTIVHGYNIVIDANQDYAITSNQYIHGTKQYSIDYIPAALFDDNNEYTIPAEYIDGEVHVIADVISGYSVKYKHLLNGEVAHTEVLITTDGTYPTPSAPWGITIQSKPTGTVTENCIKEINATYDPSVLPFTAAPSYSEINKWYYLTLDGKYIFYDANATSIPLNKTAVDVANKDIYTFAFIGNPYTGYQIVNYAAGEGKILSSSTTMSGTTGGSTYPIMTAAPVPAENNTHWMPTSSSNAANGFYLAQAGYDSNKMNNRDGKVAYWTAGQGAGSTFLVTERKMGKLGELADAIDDLKREDIQPGTDPGFYSESAVATFYNAMEQASNIAEDASDNEIDAAKAKLDAAVAALADTKASPVAGNYYIIKSAYTGWTTGDKAIYSNGTNTMWKDADYTDASFYWLLEKIENGKYFFKNAGDSKYMNGQGLSASAPTGATLTWLGTGQYNIISNGVTMHTNGHSNGSGESGNIVTWGGDANSCSAWYLVTADAPTATGNVDVTYTYKHGDDTWLTESKSLATNTPYAAPVAVFGATATSLKGYGLVRSSQPQATVICTINEDMPFKFANSWDNIDSWYFITLDTRNYYYLKYTEGETAMPLNQKSLPTAEEELDAYTFAFVGNPYTGYQIVNYAAGEGKILSSSTTMSGSTGSGTRPVMTATPVPAGNNTHWIATASTHADGGFYLAQKGYDSNIMNLRDGYLAYWSTGKDMGSTFVATHRPMDIATGIDTIKANGNAKAIYDMQGRKITNITAPGLYIIDGNKVVVE